jgi:hypothetical protein
MSDIIDNRQEKLIDHIELILDSTERAKFAVGYFFVSGLTAIREHLESIKELRLLIGNTTNRETLEQISEGYRRLELVEQAAEAMDYPKRTEIRQIRDNTASNLRGAVELVDQTDEAQEVLNLLRRNSVSGEPLINNLIRIYNQHNMDQMSLHIETDRRGDEVPRIICSETLI